MCTSVPPRTLITPAINQSWKMENRTKRYDIHLPHASSDSFLEGLSNERANNTSNVRPTTFQRHVVSQFRIFEIGRGALSVIELYNNVHGPFAVINDLHGSDRLYNLFPLRQCADATALGPSSQLTLDKYFLIRSFKCAWFDTRHAIKSCARGARVCRANRFFLGWLQIALIWRRRNLKYGPPFEI